jgi:uncharacterized iron-regulated membrane protein
VSARRLHRWLGLGLGLWFALAGLTGAVLVFWREIEAAPLPAIAAGPSLPLSELVGRAKQHQAEAPWRVFPPQGEGEPLRVEFLPEAGGRVSLYLDPTDGRVLAKLPWGGAAIHWLYELHSGHILGRVGGVAVGLSGLALAALAGLGLALWPRHAAIPWRERLVSVQGLRGRRRLANWHRVVGLRSAPLLLLAAVSGATLAFPDTTRALLEPVLPPAPAPGFGSKTGAGPLDLDGAMRLAEATHPGWRTAWLVLEDDVQVVLLPRDAPWPSGRAWVSVELFSGRVRAHGLPDAVDHVRAWLMALHNGKALGWLGRGLVVLLGLSLPVMGWLGWRLWRRGRIRGARAASGRATAQPPRHGASAPPAR